MNKSKLQWDFNYEATFQELDKEQLFLFCKNAMISPENILDTIEENLQGFPRQRDPEREGDYQKALEIANQISRENQALLHLSINPRWGNLEVSIKAQQIELVDLHILSILSDLVDAVWFRSCKEKVELRYTVDCFLVGEDKDTPESIAEHLKCNYPAAIKETGLLDTAGNFTKKGLQFVYEVYTTIQEDGNPFGFYDLLGEELGYLKDGEPTEKGCQHKNWFKEISEFSVADMSADQFRDGEKE